MFDSLSDRLGATLDGLRGQGRLTEDDINRAMREIRLALLEADVNFGVVREFVAAVKERALGADVMQSLTPGQQVIKIVHEELTSLMGTAGSGLSFASRPPTVILMAGLQGSGKTTTGWSGPSSWPDVMREEDRVADLAGRARDGHVDWSLRHASES